MNPIWLYSATTSSLSVLVFKITKPFAAPPLEMMICIAWGFDESTVNMSLQSMKKAVSGWRATLLKTNGEKGVGDSGTEITNFFWTIRFALALLGLWTLISVLYSPGTSPTFSALLGSNGAGTIVFGKLQIHLAA